MAKRANSTSNIGGRVNSLSKLEGSLLFTKNKNLSPEELKKKVETLLDLNIQRCRLMFGKGEITNWF